jgi:type II secretory pathway component PulJ
MKARGQRDIRRTRRIAGFTLIEALASIALMSTIVVALSAVQ